ncbi:MAG TPA: protein kinase [Sandaracinaceae bacterium LLY-WYZ-13_1]|nr:protein kinase [Sandaracinaceae bacterium LLY-WYZ-13_1]
MRVCSICGAKWRGDPTVCPLDGGTLEDLPDPLLGRTIGGRYVITERIGSGGMGTVYRARHEVVGRDVAIKFLSPELGADATNRRRFLREAKAANRIDHEHIIDITDFGETDDGLVYLVMEYLDGESLADLVDRGPLSTARAVTIAMQMAAALARAHELDVIHRDIKPDNVYLIRHTGGADFVKLLDFGLAKMKGEIRLTASGAVFGTPEYMAPEQARGAPLTGKADLYAVGCVIYEMLTGEPPFDGPTPDLILKHIREVPPPPSAHVGGIPVELDEVVTQLLEKDPDRRHADAYHLFEELRKVSELLPRPSSHPTIRDASFMDALNSALPARSGVHATVSSSTDTWDRKLARFGELAARAYPSGPPDWLRDALTELEEAVGELARRRAELDRSASAAMQHEEEIRAVRLRMGRAIDHLGQDESRALRQLDALSTRLDEARGRLEEIEEPLREAWDEVPPAPGDAPLEVEAVRRLRDAGQLASVWVEAKDSVLTLARDRERRAQERDDLRFQIAQLKGRLGTLSAEGDLDLDQLRDRSQRLDGEVQALLDRIAAGSEAIVKHFLQFPELRDAVRQAQR